MKKLVSSLLSLLVFSAHAQLPAYGGVAALPDSWLLSNGQPFHYKSTASPTPRALTQRTPTAQEQAVIDKADSLIQSKPAKAIALVSGDELVWVKFQNPKDSDKLFMSMSVGKTITALAVGKANRKASSMGKPLPMTDMVINFGYARSLGATLCVAFMGSTLALTEIRKR